MSAVREPPATSIDLLEAEWRPSSASTPWKQPPAQPRPPLGWLRSRVPASRPDWQREGGQDVLKALSEGWRGEGGGGRATAPQNGEGWDRSDPDSPRSLVSTSTSKGSRTTRRRHGTAEHDMLPSRPSSYTGAQKHSLQTTNGLWRRSEAPIWNAKQLTSGSALRRAETRRHGNATYQVDAQSANGDCGGCRQRRCGRVVAVTSRSSIRFALRQ